MSTLKALFLVVLLSSLAGPTLAANKKIAILDVQRAIMETDAIEKTMKTLKNDPSYRSNMREAEKIKKEGQTLVEKLRKDGPVMGNEQKLALQKRIQEKQADLEHIARKVQAREQEMLKPIVDRKQVLLQAAVKSIISKDGIGLLLDSRSAIHADVSYDITAKVTKKLNESK